MSRISVNGDISMMNIQIWRVILCSTSHSNGC